MRVIDKAEMALIIGDIYEKICDVYGESKHKDRLPHVFLEESPYSDEVAPPDLFGEYCSIMNSITVYWVNIDSLELLIRTLLHEYQHYLQSPSWMTRYYNLGHSYNTHPYELAAYNEEENWNKFI